MNLLYGFSNCTYRKYNEIFKNASVMVLQQAQKYHSLMIRGLNENGMCVRCISGLPINRSFNKSLFTRGGEESENGVNYHYFSSINLPVIRQIIIAVKAFWHTLQDKELDVAVCDILNISILIGMLAASRIRRKPIIGIVTDVPGKLADKNYSFINRINAYMMRRMDGYVLLTKWMNEIVNPKDKPHVVIEGQVDSEMAGITNDISKKESPKVLMYAGSIKQIYGIKNLTEAFILADKPDWILKIYGNGDFHDELIEICKKHKNIEYKGILLNKDIVQAEINASLLVNPRPTDKEYVKYSFPSKNMEYMASGTPLVTTHLPGMPDEYLDYVYTFEDETKEGIKNSLDIILSTNPEILHNIGRKAKKFVIGSKDQRSQAKKVCNLIDSVLQ